MGDAIGLKPCYGGVCGLCLLTINELEATCPQGNVLAVKPGKTLFKNCCRSVGNGIGGIVAGPKTQLALGAHRRDGVVRRIKNGRLGQFQLPVPAMQPLSQSNAQQGLDIAVAVVVWRSREPLPCVNSRSVVYRNVEGCTAGGLRMQRNRSCGKQKINDVCDVSNLLHWLSS